MVLLMTNEDHKERGVADFSNSSEGSEADTDCDFSAPEEVESDDVETSLVSKKLERNQHEERIIREAIGFGSDSESKWCDARGQSGPSPADFGDHKPIPVDAVCASVVLSDTIDESDLFPEE